MVGDSVHEVCVGPATRRRHEAFKPLRRESGSLSLRSGHSTTFGALRAVGMGPCPRISRRVLAERGFDRTMPERESPDLRCTTDRVQLDVFGLQLFPGHLQRYLGHGALVEQSRADELEPNRFGSWLLAGDLATERTNLRFELTELLEVLGGPVQRSVVTPFRLLATSTAGVVRSGHGSGEDALMFGEELCEAVVRGDSHTSIIAPKGALNQSIS